MLSGILVFLKRAEANCALSARDWVIFGGEITDPDCLLSQQHEEEIDYDQLEKERISTLLNIPLNSLTDDIFFFLWTQTDGNDDLIAAWHEKRWEGCQEEQQEDDGWDDDYDYCRLGGRNAKRNPP